MYNSQDRPNNSRQQQRPGRASYPGTNNAANYEQFMRRNDPNPEVTLNQSVGVGIYQSDSGSMGTPQSHEYQAVSPAVAAVGQFPQNGVAVAAAAHYPPSSPDNQYDQSQNEQRPRLQHKLSDVNSQISAPYQGMKVPYVEEDDTVERARILMASHQGKTQARPSPKPGRPPEPATQAIEPAMPASRLGRRCLTQRPKRKPDLVKGRVVQQLQPKRNVAFVECASCGVTLEIARNAIVVNCPHCSQVHHTATCRIVQSR